MTERQVQGFQLERLINERLDGYVPSTDYTSQHDGMFQGMPVSIKCMKARGDICMSDFKRIVTDASPSLMLLALRQSEFRQTLYILSFPNGTRGIFGRHADAVTELVSEFSSYMRDECSNSRAYDATWRQRRRQFMHDYVDAFCQDVPMIMPRPKRDHKHQRRLQCAVPHNRQADFLSRYAITSIQPTDIMGMTDDDWTLLSERMKSHVMTMATDDIA